jgi:S-adenosylmethionine:tRNA ribosyltransferase-isomerase
VWRVLGQTRGKLRPGEQVTLSPVHDPQSAARLQLTLVDRAADGIWLARPEAADDPFALLERFGTVPLPPYMHRELATNEDRERYQTLYARRPGAVAAPTAGLHFTPELLQACREKGIAAAYVTLHVGIGTFRPIAVETLDEHRMHAEWCEVNAETVAAVRAAREAKGRVVAVGTTSVRTLETASRDGELRVWSGETDIFIRPPFEFHTVDALLTNFHLPRSTLLVMLSAFAGRELILEAYRIAVENRYRFYSYGDAMLVL